MFLNTSIVSLRRSLAVAVVIPGLALAACDDTSPERALEYVKKAQQLYENGESRAAVIELKNALQIDGQNPDARLLLGKLYLELQDGPSAEKELTRAHELGVDDPSSRLLLAQAHLIQREYDAALRTLPQDTLGTEELDSQVLAARGHANLGLGELAVAQQDFLDALDLTPSASAYEGLARRSVILGDYDAADEYISLGLSIAPRNVDLLALDGERLFRQGNLDAAAVAFSHALDQAPENLLVRLRLARTYLQQQKFEESKTQLSNLLSQAPQNLQAKLLLGTIAFEEGDFAEALRQTSQVLSTDDGNLTALYIAGASSLALDELEKAKRYLTRVRLADPQNEIAKRLLATTQLRLDEPDAALASLVEDGALLKEESGLRLVTDAALQSGNLQGGLQYLERLAAEGSESADLRLQMGFLKIAMGQVEEGANELKLAQQLNPDLSGDPTYGQAENLLIETYIRTGQLERALAEAQRMQELRPERPEGYLYAGVAHMALKQPQAGEQSFLEALQVAPGYPPASIGLSEFEANRGNFDAAQDYLEQSLAANPENMRLLLRLAGLAQRSGDNDQVKRWLDRAVATDPSAIEPRISLSRLYMARQDPAGAVAIVTPLLPEHETNPVVLRYVAQAQAFAGQTENAVATIQKWIELAPSSSQAHLALADVYELSGDTDGMRRALDAASRRDPANPAILVRLGQTLLETGDIPATQDVVTRLEQSAPNSAAIKELQAGVALLDGQPNRAAELYREGRELDDSARLAVGMAGAQWEAGDRDAAVATLEDWTQRNPEDVATRFVTNRYYRELGQFDRLAANLSGILTVQPQNWAAHNNLAELKLQSGDFDSARTHAERAHELAPEHPGVKDTLGVVLHAQGENQRASTLLREAAQQLPGLPVIRLHLAQVLADMGETEEARRILDAVLADEQQFAERSEAEKLRQKLDAK